MGQEDRTVNRTMTTITVPPQCDQIEVSLFGPGYGECVLLHIGDGNWVIVDSCFGKHREPAALAYLQGLDSDPAESVRLIVATHWHDDHIRGMGKLVEVCKNAVFCCASVLCEQEFLAAVGALARRPMSLAGSGTQELYKVMSLLSERVSPRNFAIANRRIFSLDDCEVWTLSPSDTTFDAFLREIGRLLPREGETKRRVTTLMPNKIAVVLLIEINEAVILLGSDLERQGWLEILDVRGRPNCKASVFKVPHHGSQNAHEDRVWNEMLQSEPIALLAPWRRGGWELPMDRDVKRILSFTERAYATASRNVRIRRPARNRHNAVEKTIRETGARIWRTGQSPGLIRLRKVLGSQTDWDIETFGSACPLADCENMLGVTPSKKLIG